MNITAYYADCWFKLDYEVSEHRQLTFSATRISSMNEEDLPNSDFDQSPCITGHMKYDGCINFKQDDHYCGIFHAEQCKQLFKNIYALAKSLGFDVD